MNRIQPGVLLYDARNLPGDDSDKRCMFYIKEFKRSTEPHRKHNVSRLKISKYFISRPTIHKCEKKWIPLTCTESANLSNRLSKIIDHFQRPSLNESSLEEIYSPDLFCSANSLQRLTFRLTPNLSKKSTEKGTSESSAICFPNCHSSSRKKIKYKSLFKI